MQPKDTTQQPTTTVPGLPISMQPKDTTQQPATTVPDLPISMQPKDTTQQTTTTGLDRPIAMQPEDATQQTDTATQNQAITMEQEDTVTKTLDPSELLRQVAASMNGRHPEISVTVPRMTTWKTVLHAVDSALGEIDGPVMTTMEISRPPKPRPPSTASSIQSSIQRVTFSTSSKQSSPPRPPAYRAGHGAAPPAYRAAHGAAPPTLPANRAHSPRLQACRAYGASLQHLERIECNAQPPPYIMHVTPLPWKSSTQHITAPTAHAAILLGL